MRFGSISLLLVAGFVGMGCGSGGSGGQASGKGTPGGNDGAYQTPPSTFEPPTAINPTTYEPPPGTFESPPGQANAGGVGAGVPLSTVCGRLCQEVLSLNCDFSSSTNDSSSNDPNANPKGNSSNAASMMATPEDCAQACDELETAVPCPDEYAAAFACILDNVTLTCALFTDATTQMTVDQSLAVTCRAPLVAFATCEGALAPSQPVTPAGQCETNSCVGCPGACETCLCQNDDDISQCAICENQ